MSNDTNTESADRKSPLSKKAVTVGLAAGLLGGTAAGLMFGIPGLSSAATDTAVVEQVDDPATDPAVDPDRVAVHTERVREQLQELVDAGTITAEQADAVATHLAESMPSRGGPGRFGGRGGSPFDGEVLETLGIDVSTLMDQLRDGATLAEIATAQGVDVQALIDALVAEASELLDEGVADGRLTAEEAAEKKAELSTRITEMVNGTFEGRGGFPGGRGPFGDRLPGDEAPADEVPADEVPTDVPATTEN